VSEGRPKLVAVGGDARPEGPGGAPGGGRQPETATPRRTVWLIAGLLVLACLALGVQTRRVGALSGEVSRLSSELVGARAALVAYEGRLATVREVVGDLSRRVGELDELVRRDPLAPPEAPPEPEPPAAGTE
jgi:hypothetical protein